MDASRKPLGTRRRIATWSLWVVSSLLLAVLFALSLAFAAVVHLNLPVARRAGADILEQFLQATFEGSFEIGSFERLGEAGVTVESFTVLDPDGRMALSVRSVSVDVDVYDILQRILSGHEKISVAIEGVRVHDSEIYILPTQKTDTQGVSLGYPSIADAFEPRDKTPSDKKSGGRAVRVWFPDISLNDVFVRMSMAGTTIESRVQSAKARLLVTDKGVSVDISRFGLTASGLAGADATAHGEVHVRVPGATSGTVVGHLGGVPFEQEFRFEGDSLEVKGRLPEVRPSAVRPLLGTWPLDRSVTVANHLRGSLSRFHVVADVRHPSEEVTAVPPLRVSGTVSTMPSIRADLDVVTSALDVAGYLSTLPKSRLSSQSKVLFELEKDEPKISIETRIDPGEIGATPTPRVEASGNWSGSGLSFDAHLTEAGVDARISGEQSGQESTTFHAEIAELDVGKSPRLAALVPGLNVQTRGTVDGTLHDDHVAFRSKLSVGGIAYGTMGANSGSLTASGVVPFDDPAKARADLEVSLSTVRLDPLRLKSIELTSTGPILQPHLTAKAISDRDLELRVESDANFSTTTFTKVEAAISGQGKPIEARAKLASFADDRILVENFYLKSNGEISGNFDIGKGRGNIDVVASGLSISRIFEALGFARNEFGGDLDGSVQLDVGARPSGNWSFAVRNGAFEGIDGITLEASGTIEDRDTQGTLTGEISDLGKLSGTWQGTLGGHVLDPASYRAATGTISTSARTSDLRHLSVLMGGIANAKMLTGAVVARAEISRLDAAISPSIEFQVRTEKFGGQFAGEEKDYLVTGLDLDAGIFSRAGSDELEGAIRLDDSRGTLASTSGSLELPINAWLSKGFGNDVQQTVWSAPLDVVVVLPKRSIAHWPAFIPRPFKRGTLSARLAVTGSLSAPQVGVVVTGRNLDGEESPFSDPLDVDFNGRYVSDSGELRGGAQLASDGAHLAGLDFDLLVPAQHLTKAPPEGVPYFTGTTKIQLDNTRLDALRALRERGVHGVVQGAVLFERYDFRPSLAAEVNLRRLGFGDNLLGDALLEVRTSPTQLVTRAQFDDDYGTLHASCEMGIKPTPLAFIVAEARPVFATIEADRYDAAVLLPVVSDVFDELSGALTGKLRVVWTPPTKADGTWSTDLSGSMKMTDGVLTPSALGLRLEEARLNMTAGREGAFNVVRFKNFAARAESADHNLEADAVLYFDNLDLVKGSFSVRPDHVPLKSDGADIATVDGEAVGNFEMKENDNEMRLVVDIDEMTATLPEVADNDLFALEENPSIEILQHKKRDTETEVEEDAMIIAVKVNLGQYVRIQSDILNLRVTGSPEVVLADKLEMSGAIQTIPGGRVNVMGRRFTVERAAVQFATGDPQNPQISATAAWTAPNGVVVRANLEGTVAKPILTWTSDPALAGGEADIISLVLGGGSGGDPSATGISSLAVAANEAIGQTGVKGVEFYTTQEASTGTARMASLNDTSSENYTAAVRISDELWFEGSYQRAAGASLGRDRSGVSGTLDWRFHPQWSLRTEIGTLGAGLDMVWQYRY